MLNSAKLTTRRPSHSESLTDGPDPADGPTSDPAGPPGPLLAAALTLLTGSGLLGCGDASGALDPGEARVAETLEISPDSTAGWTGDTARVRARALDADGRPVEGVGVSWASSDTAVAAVDRDGVVTFRETGSTTISASLSSGGGDLTASTSTTSRGGKPDDVTVSPDSTSTGVGGSVQLSATVTGTDGSELDSEPEWTSLAGDVAAVDADGTVTGRSSGTARIEARRGPARDTATVVVDADGTVTDTSTSSATGAEPYVVDDFSTYSSTSDMLSDPRDIYAPNYDSYNTENITLVSEGVDVDGYSLDQSMRYTFPDNGGACGDQSISRSLNMPEDTYVVWVEWYVKFDADFTTDFGNSNCAPAYKLLFGRQDADRFDIVTGLWDSDYKVAWPGGNVDNVGGDAAASYDGQWHRFRIEFRHESSAGANDGAIRFWVDDTRVVEKTGLDTDRSSGPMKWVKLGANINQGPDFAGMGLNWGRVAVWTSDPGW